MRVAVYGTLRRGTENELMEDDIFAKLRGYKLVYPGQKSFPAAAETHDPEDVVRVELMEADVDTLLSFDRYEGVELGLYDRKKATVELYDGSTEEVWVYVAGKLIHANKENWELIESGDWYNRS